MRPGVLQRVFGEPFPGVTGTEDPIPDVDAAPTAPTAPFQLPPPRSHLDDNAVESLGQLLVESLAAMRDLSTLAEPLGPGAVHSTSAVYASPSIRVAAQTTPQLVLPRNSGRRGMFVFSEPGTATCYLGLSEGNDLTTLTYAVQIVAGQLYELPGPPYYGGPIAVLFAAATGNVLVTELT